MYKHHNHKYFSIDRLTLSDNFPMENYFISLTLLETTHIKGLLNVEIS